MKSENFDIALWPYTHQLISHEFMFPNTTAGDVVLLYASKYHDIPAVVNLSGRYDLNTGLAERLGKNFMEQIKEDGYIDVMNRNGNHVLYLVVFVVRIFFIIF